MLSIVQSINYYLSDYLLVFVLVGIGLTYTIKTRFVQVRCFKDGFSAFFLKGEGSNGKGSLTVFQTLATAIASQVGTGNIIGACGAILTGGPGSIFWMWVIAFFGMATIYAEAVLAQQTRIVKEDGTILGGPVYYIKKAFKGFFGKVLSVFFAIAIIIALGFMGCMVQANSISATCKTAFGIPEWVIGLVIAVASAFIFFGGVQRIAKVTEKMVPIMAALYLVGGFIVLLIRLEYLPETFMLIFKYAFSPDAIIGGSLGMALKTAISQGVKRGLFSNEAGMGSTPHIHALADAKTPHDQGVVAMMGVFIDTFVVLTMTALVVISSLYAGNGILMAQDVVGVDKTNMVQIAFAAAFGNSGGNAFVAVCLLFFAFSSILGWNLMGSMNVEYLFGKKGTYIYSAIAVLFIFMGACVSNELAWELSDMFNNLMVLPNAMALIALQACVVNKNGK